MEVEDTEKVIPTMRGFFDKEAIADFILLNKIFGDIRYQLLIKKAMDLESKILITAAKNNQTFYSVVSWAKESGLAKSSTLSDRKQYLLDLGVISETPEKNDKRGRPRKVLYMSDKNMKKFEETYGRAI